MALLKLSGSKGRSTEIEPGVTLRITDDKLESREAREEVAQVLMKNVPRLVEKVLGEQLEIDSFTEEKKSRKKKDDDE